MYSGFLTLQIIGICLLFLTLSLLLNGEGSREQKLSQFFIGASLIQNTAYMFELTSQTKEAALVATKMEYLGSVFIALFYCRFIFNYCYEKEPALLMKIIFCVNIIYKAICFIYAAAI